MAEKQDLLFELGTEELPPTALPALMRALTAGFAAGLADAGLAHGAARGYATPRRLSVTVADCAARQADRRTRRRGPAARAAFGADGKPTKAALGFARSCGVAVADLGRERTDKGEWLVYDAIERGRAAAEVLPAIAAQALDGLPIPKRMRWGAGEARFARPVHWLVFMLGARVVPCELLGVAAGDKSRGHRFHHPGPITLGGAAEYVAQLKAARVIADFAERREIIAKQVADAAAAIGGRADTDDALLDEVAALVEWPRAITAAFEEQYLDAPHEALVYTMKKNQRYFPLRAADGALLNRFITVANIESAEPDIIRAGNERVVRPRLADAMFFWRRDCETALGDRLPRTREVVFQKDLGSMHDKAARVATAAGRIAAAIGGDKALAERAGLLSRCDLLTTTVGEFPDLQGVIGRHLAGRDGEDSEVAAAMDELYMPRFSGDRLPRTKIGIAVAVADKIDTLVGVFGVGLKPTGDKDPFALRRAALGVLRILREHELRVDLSDLLEHAAALLGDKIGKKGAAAVADTHAFMLERLRGMYSSQADAFNAVAARQQRLGNIADFDKRARAVTDFSRLRQAEALAAANKRIGNILKKSAPAELPAVDSALLKEKAEKTLRARIQAMEEKIAPMLEQSDYAAALKTLAALREPVDTFFDEVMVIADDERLKNNRLALLSSLQRLFGQVADISLLRPTA